MTLHDANWASQHDWFLRYDVKSGIVWVRSKRPEGGMTAFRNFFKLQAWAGY